MITSVLFDLDDLVVDTASLHFAANDLTLKEFGVSAPRVPAELTRRLYGMRMREIMELLLDHFAITADPDLFLRRRNEHFMAIVRKGVGPMPGLNPLLKNIGEWKMKRALATSGMREYVEEVVTQLKLADFFDAVVTGDEVETPKPAPDTFLMAAKKLGVEPCECVVLEDSTHGVMAAKRAGMMAIGVQNSVTPAHQDLSMADIVVSCLDEITREML